MKDDNNEQPTRPIDDDDDDKEEGQGGQERPTALDDDSSSSAVPSAEAAAAVADTGEEEGSSRGDPRMRRACLARIANPSLTLLAALKIGGFTFQQESPTCEDFDDDGVRLRQRKNQLCRRIRTEKAVEDEGRGSGGKKRRFPGRKKAKGTSAKRKKRSGGGTEADLDREAASGLFRLASDKDASGGRKGQNRGDSTSDADSDANDADHYDNDGDRKPPAIQEGAGNVAGVASSVPSLSAPPGSINLLSSAHVGAPPVLPQGSLQAPVLSFLAVQAATRGQLGALAGGANGLLSALLKNNSASISGEPPPVNSLALFAQLQQGIPLQQSTQAPPAPHPLQLQALASLMGGSSGPPPPHANLATFRPIGSPQQAAPSNPNLAAVLAAISHGSSQNNQIAVPPANNVVSAPSASIEPLLAELIRRNPANAGTILQIAQALGTEGASQVPAPAPVSMLAPATQGSNSALSTALIQLIQQQQQRNQNQNQRGGANCPSNPGPGPTTGK